MSNLIKILFLIIAVSFFIIGGIYFMTILKQNEDLYKNYQKINYELEGKSVKLLVADTPEKREKGLMYIRELKGVDGMIFLFLEKHTLSFWNKNTLMDLDLYWIEEEKVVGKSFLPSIEKSKNIVTVSSPSPADKVIEIPAKN